MMLRSFRVFGCQIRILTPPPFVARCKTGCVLQPRTSQGFPPLGLDRKAAERRGQREDFLHRRPTQVGRQNPTGSRSVCKGKKRNKKTCLFSGKPGILPRKKHANAGGDSVVVQLILAVSVAIIVSALCSVAEAALYSIPQSQVEVLARSGRLSGRVLAALRREIARPITAILTLNTVANTMGAAVAGAAAAAVLGERLLPLFSLGFTLAILFFSEIIPKTVGVAHSRTIAPLIAVPLAGLVRLLTPLIALCQIVTRFVSSHDESNLVSTDEITALASLSRRSGIIDLQQEKIIRNIVQLRGKSVRQAMTPRTVVCSLDQHMTVGAAMSIRQEWDRHSRIPVYDQG
ncbi:MAG TPA: DUF21 domain-containing protein, partial [Desulfobacterales bacterium]|nr:DUF21 domain-containing protein [Desulfobacterales bacterium]